MNVFIAYFSQMGRRGCGADPTFLLSHLERDVRAWTSVARVESKCYQAPGAWMEYASKNDDETSVGSYDEIYPQMGATAREAWHELQEKSEENWLFIFVGASNGCIPACFFAHQYHDHALSLLLLSCVPGREQWGDVARFRFPVVVTAGWREEYFGGRATIYEFANMVHATVIAFTGRHLEEGEERLLPIAQYVAATSRPQEAKEKKARRNNRKSSPGRNSPPRGKTKSPERKHKTT